MNSLMKLKKIELIAMINRLQEEKDILFDEKESLKDDLNSVETYEEEFHKLEELRDIIENIKIAKERHFLGVATAFEDFQKYNEALFNYID